MTKIEDFYQELNSHIIFLDEKFINKHIPPDPASSYEEFSYDVKAYCILAHAAFEEFFESTALLLANTAVEQWTIARKSSDMILSLLSCHGERIAIEEDETKPEKKPFDYLRPIVENAKSSFSREIHSNHGISISYLRSLLIPVAVEIPQDANLLNSLGQLATGRGDYAHKRKAKIIIAPEDAKGYVHDVLSLSQNIRDKGIANLAKIE